MMSPDDLFAAAVELEQDPKTQREAAKAYKSVIEKNPDHAASHINLGTLYFKAHDYENAEMHYRLALAVDPKYALAWFDIGNVFDETDRLQEAIDAYSRALVLAPTYADAHYNLALSYERDRQSNRALFHWRAYTKLDPASSWSIHAHNQIKRIVTASGFKLIHSTGRAAKTGSAKLFLVVRDHEALHLLTQKIFEVQNTKAFNAAIRRLR